MEGLYQRREKPRVRRIIPVDRNKGRLSSLPFYFMKKIQPIFITGLGDRATNYRALSKYLNIKEVDWNRGSLAKLQLGKPDVLIGFSLGCMVACMHAEKYKVKKLILCSMTPGTETLKKIKADKVIFMVGTKEDWVAQDIMRVMHTLPKNCKCSMVVVGNVGHKIIGPYRKELLKQIKGIA